MLKKKLVMAVAVSMTVTCVFGSFTTFAAEKTGVADIFDSTYYLKQNPDVGAVVGTDEEALLDHYLTYGLKEGRVASTDLDVAKYRASYPDLNTAFSDNWDLYVEHYYSLGKSEGRDNGGNLVSKVKSAKAIDYAKSSNWAYYENNKSIGDADIFFVAPTTYSGRKGSFLMPIDNEKERSKFFGAINMEKGIYDGNGRFFAPYYRQIGLSVYDLDDASYELYVEAAYQDVKAAFEYYLKHENKGTPIVLAGFSQGADLCIRLLKDEFKDPAVNNLLVACYAIGWRVTEEEMQENPHLKFAQGEADTGVIVAFNSEAKLIDDSLMIPKGTKTLAINPLNWKTTGEMADKSLNLGACFTNYDGNIEREIPALTGAYIDSERGALKVVDVSPKEYPAGLSLFEDGVYHLYDYQFFYRNLQENVAVRVNAYKTK